MCLYPRLLKNKKYQPTKKNKGIVPKMTDARTEYVSVGCGKCMECMKKKKRDWIVRLNEEIKNNTQASFVTLTFNDENLKAIQTKIEIEGMQNEIAIYAVRHFLERWRKKYKKSIKHWLVTELGHTGTERIHMHGILWTKNKEEIYSLWKYGYVYIGEWVNEKTMNYITKYITKTDIQHKDYTPIVLCSPGIGKKYIEQPNSKKNRFEDEIGKETDELYRSKTGTKLPLPIYYRNKIYNEDEREYLWCQKLDKQTRYICGEKIDVSTEKGEKQFEELQKYYRKRNKELGYGDAEKDYNKKLYRQNCRKIKELGNKKNIK